MTLALNRHSAHVAAAVTELCDGIFAHILGWQDAIEAYVQEQAGNVNREGIDTVVADLVLPLLGEESGTVVGAGFVAHPTFVSAAPWHLAWWLGDRNTFSPNGTRSGARRLQAIEDETADGFRDYTTLEWWRRPIQDGRPHITGPYVDYLCTDEYTLTLTTPVSYRGSVIGVVGADVYVRDIERILLPRLQSSHVAVSVVNEAGRVLVSTDARLATGSLMRLRGLPAVGSPLAPGAPRHLDGGYEVISCGTTGLSLVIAQTTQD